MECGDQADDYGEEDGARYFGDKEGVLCLFAHLSLLFNNLNIFQVLCCYFPQQLSRLTKTQDFLQESRDAHNMAGQYQPRGTNQEIPMASLPKHAEEKKSLFLMDSLLLRGLCDHGGCG